jgi:hypothetical protein
MDKDTQEAYQRLFRQAINHSSDSSRNMGALLLNSYNYDIPGTGFSAGQFRNLDSENQRAVLRYLAWLGSGFGLYPPDADMDQLKAKWVAMGWLEPAWAS